MNGPSWKRILTEQRAAPSSRRISKFLLSGAPVPVVLSSQSAPVLYGSMPALSSCHTRMVSFTLKQEVVLSEVVSLFGAISPPFDHERRVSGVLFAQISGERADSISTV